MWNNVKRSHSRTPKKAVTYSGTEETLLEKGLIAPYTLQHWSDPLSSIQTHCALSVVQNLDGRTTLLLLPSLPDMLAQNLDGANDAPPSPFLARHAGSADHDACRLATLAR
jgi:hypothetical protein